MDLAAGDRVGPYTIIGPLGRGGMGQVMLAHDPRLQRKVALKRLLADDARAGAPERAHDRILTEARAAAQITHPNVAAVHDVIEDEGRAFIVMEYVEGETLERQLSRGRLPFERVLSIAKQLGTGLAAAHAKGVIHRDLKPSNIQVTAGGSIKILDFGVARAPAISAATMTSGTTATVATDEPGRAGTPPYMSPEQLLRRKVDERSDLYSLGIVLYEMAVGRRPFAEHGSLELALAMAQSDPPPPATVDPSIPIWFSRIVAKLLARDPRDRFQSAASVLDALDLQTVAGETSRPVRGAAARRTWIAAAAIVAIAAAIVATPAGRRFVTRTPPPPVGVAVLPVETPTGDIQAVVVASGIDALVRSNFRATPAVAIMPRATVAGFDKRREDLAALRDLGAAFVVDLKLTTVNPRLHLTARVRRTDRRSNEWSHTFVGDQLPVQRELMSSLATALGLKGAWRQPTTNADALSEYSRARALANQTDVGANLSEAIALLKSAVAKDPSFGLAHAALADAYSAQYQRTRDPALVDAATRAVNNAIQTAPDEGRVYYSLGNLQNVSGRREEAIRSLQRAAQLQPDDDDAHRLLGVILAARGEVEAGIAEVRRAVAIRPDYWNNHYSLGFIYYNAARYPEAIVELRRVTELQPNNARGYNLLGAAFHRIGDLLQAIGNYEHAVRLGPNANAYSNLGVVYYSAGRVEDAITAFRTAVERDPTVPEFRQNLGDALRLAGDGLQARAAYAECVDLGNRQMKINAKKAITISLIAVCEAKMGRRDEAEPHAAEALALEPDNREIVYRSAVVAALLNDAPRALARLRDALALGYQRQLARDDDDLASIRRLPKFAEIVSTAK